MTAEHQPPPEVKGPEILTPEKATRLLFRLFYVSQGNPYLLRYAMAWVHNRYPNYKIAEEQINDLLTQFTPKAHSYLHSSPGTPSRHVAVGPNEEGFTVHQGVTDLARILNANEEWTVKKLVEGGLLPPNLNVKKIINKSLIENLARIAIARDHHFLITLGGRPTGQDKFFSQVCGHALLEQPSGIAETDALFEAVGECVNVQISNGDWNRHFFPNLYAMVDKYNQEHPNSQVKLPEGRSNASAQRPPDSMLV